MITISNEFLTANFSEIGAELKSLRYCDREYIWHGDPAFWSGSAPVLFPICSGLKDDEFIFEGKTYSMRKHGFAKGETFVVEEIKTDRVVFLLSSKNCPKENYPFEYELRIIYTLVGKKINVEYKVDNHTDGDMYFSIGAHEGYVCPEGIENYEIIFDQKENLDAYQLVGPLLSFETINYGQGVNILQLDNSLFANDCLIFKNLNSKSLILRNKANDRQIRVKFDGFPYLLIWTVVGAPYVCIEPWCGITDNIDTTKQLTQKEGIEKINKGDTFYRIHNLEII